MISINLSGSRCVVPSGATSATVRRVPDGLDVSHGAGAPELALAAFIADVGRGGKHGEYRQGEWQTASCRPVQDASVDLRSRQEGSLRRSRGRGPQVPAELAVRPARRSSQVVPPPLSGARLLRILLSGSRPSARIDGRT